MTSPLLRATGGRRCAVLLALLLAGCAAERGDPLKPPEDESAPPRAAEQPATDLETGPETARETARETGSGALPGEDAVPATAAADGGDASAPDMPEVPQIYMALQPDAGGPTSVILAIDASRDNTPSDDPAVRITPDGGECNPQQLRWYDFPPERAQRPTYGPEEAARGVTARELPDYMATAVTSEMIAAGLIDDPEESQPQNVCTRKLLQRIIIDRSATG